MALHDVLTEIVAAQIVAALKKSLSYHAVRMAMGAPPVPELGRTRQNNSEQATVSALAAYEGNLAAARAVVGNGASVATIVMQWRDRGHACALGVEVA